MKSELKIVVYHGRRKPVNYIKQPRKFTIGFTPLQVNGYKCLAVSWAICSSEDQYDTKKAINLIEKRVSRGVKRIESNVKYFDDFVLQNFREFYLPRIINNNIDFYIMRAKRYYKDVEFDHVVCCPNDWQMEHIHYTNYCNSEGE